MSEESSGRNLETDCRASRRRVDSVPESGRCTGGSLESHGLPSALRCPQEPLPLWGPVPAGRPGPPAPQQ